MNIPVYGVTRSKIWTASELLGEETDAPVGSEYALRNALKHAGEMKRKGGNLTWHAIQQTHGG